MVDKVASARRSTRLRRVCRTAGVAAVLAAFDSRPNTDTLGHGVADGLGHGVADGLDGMPRND
jgi:hypothetical protein